jgi:hypothetical protein
MQNQSIEKFKQYLKTQKDDFLQDGRRVEGIIRDIFPEEKLLINLLTSAWKAGVVAELGQTANLDVSIAQCGDRLCHEHGTRELSALTAVRVWAYALGVTNVVPEIHDSSTSSIRSLSGNTPVAAVCSFCGKDQDSVKQLVKGKTGYICNECVDICNEIIKKAKPAEIKTTIKNEGIAKNAVQLMAGIRETSSDGRFIAYDNETVLDTKTNLMWAAKDNGGYISWQDAKIYCDSYHGGGHNDWRMPTKEELAGLVDKSGYEKRGQFSKYFATDLIYLTHPLIWSSETYIDDAVCFQFNRSGYSPWVKKSFNCRALPVRSGK